MTGQSTAGREAWDAFWAEISAGRTETIRGIEVQVPTDMPLAMEKRIQELRESSSEEDVAELIALLFGADLLGQWRDAGMGLKELQTVLTWGMAQASGRDITFGEALDLVRSGVGEGKPLAPPGPNRAARRGQSKSTGGQSKRTSPGNTGSARKKSRG